MPGRARVERHISGEVELGELRLEAAVVEADRATVRGRILGDDARGATADEVARRPKNLAPQRRVERCVIDVADDRREPPSFVHSHRHRLRRESCGT
jgi:hypothetical protein